MSTRHGRMLWIWGCRSGTPVAMRRRSVQYSSVKIAVGSSSGPISTLYTHRSIPFSAIKIPLVASDMMNHSMFARPRVAFVRSAWK